MEPIGDGAFSASINWAHAGQAIHPQLRQCIQESSATVIVAHENDARSNRFLNEHVRHLFGARGFRERLYVIAMQERGLVRSYDRQGGAAGCRPAR